MILIADDSDLMRGLLRSLVEEIDGNIVECGDGGEAVTLYERYRPDWVLMDVAMRPMDGLTATRAIVKAFPDARVVIITDYNDATTRAKALEAGACEFFGKDNVLPVRPLISGQLIH